MTPIDPTVNLIRHEIHQMGPETEQAVQAAAQAIRDTLRDHGTHGLLALALVGAEISALGDQALAAS